ncbi:N-alpha-acetyltransferase 60 [Lamellibrachia satsuma]|nr:N-alpha-acetyltransferase 60 [Lamellibrachia satsuma]
MTTHSITFGLLNQVQLRNLCPTDIPAVKKLCAEWFPIDYPDSWFEAITSNTKFYSLAAIFDTRIIGIIVSEVKRRFKCNREDADILASSFPLSTEVAYILSLGVVETFRRCGIASLLLNSLLSYLLSAEQHNCKAIYLHVLTTNVSAIRFYERQNFKQHSFLPYYYSIHAAPHDAYCYVLYMNGAPHVDSAESVAPRHHRYHRPQATAGASQLTGGLAHPHPLPLHNDASSPL